MRLFIVMDLPLDWGIILVLSGIHELGRIAAADTFMMDTFRHRYSAEQPFRLTVLGDVRMAIRFTMDSNYDRYDGSKDRFKVRLPAIQFANLPFR